uniref:Putative ovule protein n=1 Tax=Solanum chacoense TaxID=4108 RepID=A0A0V0H5J3_SOLCH
MLLVGVRTVDLIQRGISASVSWNFSIINSNCCNLVDSQLLSRNLQWWNIILVLLSEWYTISW